MKSTGDENLNGQNCTFCRIRIIEMTRAIA